jgi:Tol biopolymer transport system component
MRVFLAALLIAGAFIAPARGAFAQQPIEAVSVNTDGTAAIGVDSYDADALSADGRFVVFSSLSTLLVEGDDNHVGDVFVRDRATGTNHLMSIASDGTQGDSDSFLPSISGDGRFVAFRSNSDTFAPDFWNYYPDVFLHDRDPDGNGVFDEGNATTILISRKWDGEASDRTSSRPRVSGDGGTVVFESDAQLTPDADAYGEIYAYDVASGTLTCISLPPGGQPGGGCANASISFDGKLVAFESPSAWLVENDTNGRKDVFVTNRETGSIRRMSVATDGTEGDLDSSDAAISADGSTVAFVSASRKLVDPPTDGRSHVFVRARGAQTTTLVTQLSDGTFADGDSFHPALSGDGNLVAFFTNARNLVPLDTNGATDVVLADRAAGTFEKISADCVGFSGNAKSLLPAISPDGRFVTFFSSASNLTDEGFLEDTVYLRDRTISWPMGSATTYGDGWPGTLGVPALTASTPPQYGATIDLTFDNSWGFWNVGFLLLGLQQTELQTAKDGTLLVSIADIIPLALNPAGTIVQGAIPFDAALCGFEIDLQGIELDPGASKGVAFTAGLQLLIGR